MDSESRNGEPTAAVVQLDPAAQQLTPDLGRMLPTVESAKSAMTRYVAVCNGILDKTADYAEIDGRLFKRKSAWRKLARFYRVSDSITQREVVRRDDGWPLYAVMTVLATDGVGASTGTHEVHLGEKCCASVRGQQCRKARYDDHRCCPADCDGTVHWKHPGDIVATAHTRAKNRAIADLIGAGEVSAEEMEGADYGGPPLKAAQRPRQARQSAPKPQRGPSPLERKQAEFLAAVGRRGVDSKDTAAVHAFLGLECSGRPHPGCDALAAELEAMAEAGGMDRVAVVESWIDTLAKSADGRIFDTTANATPPNNGDVDE